MTAPQATDWRDVENAIHRWITSALGIDFIWQDQDVDQPAYPYGTLKVISAVQRTELGDQIVSENAQDADDCDIDHTQSLAVTVSVQINVDGTDKTTPEKSSRALMNRALASLNTYKYREILTRENVVPFEKRQIGDFALIVGDTWIGRSQVEVLFYVTDVLTETVAGITTAVVSSTTDGADPALDWEDYQIGP